MTVQTLPIQSHVFLSRVAEQKLHARNGNNTTMTVDTSSGTIETVIDACTGAAVGALGWGDKDIPSFYEKALKDHVYSFPANIINESSEKLAKLYIDNSPPNAFVSALWTCSGSESSENALKIIRQYQKERGKDKKIKVISRESSYHGFTLGAMSMSDNVVANQFDELKVDQENIFLKMPRCYPYRDMKPNETEEQYGQRLVDTLEKIIIDNDPETVSCVVVETLPGSSLGTAPPPKNYLKGLRDICNKYDIIFYLDEVMCGTGRSNPNGKFNCWENFLAPEDAPDIQTVGKTLGSGYVTIAGVLVGPKIMNAYINGSGCVVGGQTYHSHSLNCGVSLQIQEKILANGLTANIFKMGNLLGERLKNELVDSPIVGDVRGIGGFWSVEFVKDKTTKESFPKELHIGKRVADLLLKNGMYVMGLTNQDTRNQSTDIILFAPAFTITEEDVEKIVSIASAGIAKISKELTAEGAL